MSGTGVLQAAVARSCFSLVRLVPLLEALGSPLAGSVRDVATCRLAGDPARNASLIELSDYLEASRWESGTADDARGLEFRIAFLGLTASGAGDPAWGASPEGVLVNALGLWRTVDGGMDRTSVDGERASRVGEFEGREAQWQGRERSAFADEEVTRSAVAEYVEALADDHEMSRAELTRVVAACGWESGGPCALGCDWPVCTAREPNCVEGRRWRQQSLGARLRRKHGATTQKWYLEVLYYEERADGVWEELLEISPEGHELRKIVKTPRGTDAADVRQVAGDACRLNKGSVLSFEVISSRSDLAATEISAADFEHRWLSARSPS
ncbi:hypothetical protein KDL01_40000 [Actinospica durhamensis]|uniref:Uncharacterized protein n=1 Tax=Actinospica durhamensis TaxID=1508375 RepID=A0A941EWK4_9ACTN|nr:hypothetical protein [Actinospica durhamensis]MBR7839507.1 hypothetical protein [Actinospica durhamensis]